MLRMITGRPSPSGFESATTAEQVTEDIDGSKLTAIVTGSKAQSRAPLSCRFVRQQCTVGEPPLL
ncbi:hypothetical protein P3L10_027002 [Capsicum annuum]